MSAITEHYEPLPPETERVGSVVVDCAAKMHLDLGPGMLESVYERCLAIALIKRGLVVERQVPVSITYEGQEIADAFRLDLLVCGCVVVEIKATPEHHPVFEAQLLTYLRMSGIRLGYLINFGMKTMKDGIKRRVV